MPQQNPLDKLAEELGEWIDQISSAIADSVLGGFAAPGAAQLNEQQKLEYYSRMLFNPDGTPNDAGRAQEMQRLGPEGFAEVYQEVTRAHPEWAAQQPVTGPPLTGAIGPDGMPGLDIAPDGLPREGARVMAPDGLPYENAPVAGGG